METTRVERVSGVLAHPTSFPGPHGIGDLGEAAYRFVDWLTIGGQRLWQLMPLGPTGYGDSPYAALSAFAGNPLLISLDRFVGEGLLDAGDREGLPDLHQWEVEYGPVIDLKLPLLQRAFDRFRAGAAADQRPAFAAFRDAQAGWLDDFALFLALKNEHGGQPWTTWEAPLGLREPGAIGEARQRLAGVIRFHEFVQFQFYRQWADLRRYANERDVRIVGDVPIFVAHDSADGWANR